MKKLLKFSAVFAAAALILTGCSSSSAPANQGSQTGRAMDVQKLDPANPVTIKIGADNVPHSELLEHVAPNLLKEGIKLDILTYSESRLMNKNVEEGEIDLNYFQHIQFLNQEIKEKGYKLESAGGIHVEPIGLYSKKVKSLSELKDGALVLVSNNKTDWGRILKILQDAGLVKIREGVEIVNATFDDVVENPKNLQFKYDNDRKIMVQYYQQGEGDLVAINTNFVLDAKINPKTEAVAIESSDKNPYENIITVKTGDKDKLVTKKIVEALKSEDAVKFIEEEYRGAVLPVK